MLLLALLGSVAISLPMVACDKDPGDHLEDAAENLGDAAEDVGDAIEDAVN